MTDWRYGVRRVLGRRCCGLAGWRAERSRSAAAAGEGRACTSLRGLQICARQLLQVRAETLPPFLAAQEGAVMCRTGRQELRSNTGRGARERSSDDVWVSSQGCSSKQRTMWVRPNGLAPASESQGPSFDGPTRLSMRGVRAVRGETAETREHTSFTWSRRKQHGEPTAHSKALLCSRNTGVHILGQHERPASQTSPWE